MFLKNFEMPNSSGEEGRILLLDRQQRAFIASNMHAHLGSQSPDFNSQYLPASDTQGNLHKNYIYIIWGIHRYKIV
jgi:hypothetical protein